MTLATRWFSLQRRLLLLLLGGVTVGWLAAMGHTYVEARHEIEKLLTSHHADARDDDEAAAHLRHELAEHFVETLLTPLLFGLPLLGGWIWFATRRGMAPLAAVAEAVTRRAPERLEPLVPAAAPLEIRPLVEALNDLFGRVSRTIEREREFTANAAHELRTPLAAVAAQTQVAQQARDAGERDHALGQIRIGVDRASRLVEQLLTLARLDPAAGLAMAEVRLDRLVAEVCADHGPAALDKGIELELDAPQAVAMVGHAELLAILLRNLIDNAVRYTPPGGKVGIDVRAADGRVVLRVSDSGPGIPAAERVRAVQRFQRLTDRETAGSGLGLSIVARIAELHDARLELAAGCGLPGLCVELEFPRGQAGVAVPPAPTFSPS